MSNRCYYEDAYTTQFQAKVIEISVEEKRQGLILDETFFYPESGGQPSDFGTINGRSVAHISIREDDDVVVHWLSDAGGTFGVGDVVTAVIDWPRRFDHMQQHSGQHILSQAFIQVAEAETVSFHLSENNVTIDVDRTNLTEAEIIAVEHRANQVVWENRPITMRFVSLEEAKTLPIRKIPPTRNGRLRLIDITDYDLTACGGTHVSHTGSVGLIKLVKQEKRGEKTRIEFCCGGRALQDYAQKHTIVSDLTAELTTSQNEIVPSITKMRQENKDTQRTIKKQKEALIAGMAQNLFANGSQYGSVTLIKQTFDETEATDLRTLAAHLTQQNNTVVLLGQFGKRTQLILSRSAETPGDMNQLLKVALAQLGNGGGGGNADFAQGGGPPHTREEVVAALDTVQSHLVDGLSQAI